MNASGNQRDIGSAPALEPPCLHQDMSIADVMVACGEASNIMAAYGLHCFSCSMGGAESLREGCALHGFDEETVDALVEDLNASLRGQPPRPATITFSAEAVRALGDIAHRERLPSSDFVIAIDATGDFSLEPRAEETPDEQLWFCADDSALRVFASPLVLWRWGGSTVTFHNGRFVLREAAK